MPVEGRHASVGAGELLIQRSDARTRVIGALTLSVALATKIVNLQQRAHSLLVHLPLQSQQPGKLLGRQRRSPYGGREARIGEICVAITTVTVQRKRANELDPLDPVCAH